MRKAALMSRACAPTVTSPISPSSSAFVTRAATESSTITSSALERTNVSQIRSASSPELGWDTSRSSRLTPNFFAYCGSRACSTSMKAARPPRFCACAMTVSVKVVLPDDSGPKTSTTRPRGKPPTPSARSIRMFPVGMTSISTILSSPRRMMAPSPKSLAICWMARSRFLFRAAITLFSVGFSSVLVAIGGLLGKSCAPHSPSKKAPID